jgi:hypothetical protein
MSLVPDNSSSITREQVAEDYLKVLQLIDDRVAPLLGKATTRVLVQVAAKRVIDQYPFLHFLMKMPYTEVVPSVIHEQLSGVSAQELDVGLNALLQACFDGLRELTDDIIAPPLHAEVNSHLKQWH